MAFFLLIVLFSGCATPQLPSALNHLNGPQQALIVRQINAAKPLGILEAWEQDQGHWQKIDTARVVLGRTGLAAPGAKKEGDGHTPSGVYPITTAFGYESHADTGLNYKQATDVDFWVDDVASPQYNQWVHGTPQANSFEHMKRPDKLYRFGAVIEYNTNPIVPGNGSAIFLHIWRAYYKPTAGCVAASERNIRRLLKWLDKNKQPVIILGEQ